MSKMKRRLARLNECFLGFGADPVENINLLVAACGELMGGASAFYTRLDEGVLCSIGMWNSPRGYEPESDPEGHLCHDVILGGESRLLVVRDLPNTTYATSDPRVNAASLQSYAGMPVKLSGSVVGSVCVVFTEDFTPAAEDEWLMGNVAAAVAVEEQRLRSQLALRASASKYRTLFNNIADAVLIFDKESHRFLGCNEAVTRIYGYSKDEILSMTPFDLHGPGDMDKVRQNINVRNLADPNTYVHMTKDGTEMHVEILTDETSFDGRPAWISIVRNISEYKQMEWDLLQAKEAAEAESRAKGDFLANVSHEIRTPMGGIIGLTDLMLNTELTVEQGEYLGMMKRSANALLAVIDDILDSSRIESGRIELHPIDFTLRTALVDTLESLDVQAIQKGLELNYRVEPEVPDDLHGDVSRLRQVLVNLVGNAIKYTERGRIDVKVENQALSDSDVMLHAMVSDTGIGIQASRLDQIFEPFTQVDGSLARSHGGTGLGLAICKSLVEIMGGEIWSESEPGEGSTFHFTVRFGVRRAVTPEVLDGRVDLQGVTALVVDENEASRSALTNTFRRWGMTINEADGHDQVFAALMDSAERADPASRLLIVAHTARADGFALAEKIRALEMRTTVRMIILTELGRIGDGALCRRLGIDGYLTRPVRNEDLRLTVAWLASPDKDGSRPELITRHSLRESMSTSKTGNVRDLSILIAEDNPVNQLVIRRMLEKSGQRVEVASDGREALDMIRRDSFDLVLMDVQMPLMDGIEATAAVREAERATGAHLPIVALTALAMAGDRDRCLAAGMDAYLAKPVKRRDLLDVVERMSSCEGRCTRG